ncbi:TPA: response regulator transcription factor [Enterobacter bugandensis]|nr:response regulator transcription factor [Enterobacter bugandensis]
MSQSGTLPDLIIIDPLSTSKTIFSSLILLRKLKYGLPFVLVVVLTLIDDARIISQLKKIRGLYNLSKKTPVTQLIYVYNYLLHNPNITTFSGFTRITDGNSNMYFSLSPCQIQVLDHYLSGASITDTAVKMGRDVRTISCHKRSAMKKLHFKSDSELIKWWVSIHQVL